jgi:hypothetical protein
MLVDRTDGTATTRPLRSYYGKAVPFEYESIRAKTQQALVDFLNAELGLGNTFTQSASLAYDAGHTQHYEQAKQHAIRAAESIHRFMDQVGDRKIRSEISDRLEELERRISVL